MRQADFYRFIFNLSSMLFFEIFSFKDSVYDKLENIYLVFIALGSRVSRQDKKIVDATTFILCNVLTSL